MTDSLLPFQEVVALAAPLAREGDRVGLKLGDVVARAAITVGRPAGDGVVGLGDVVYAHAPEASVAVTVVPPYMALRYSDSLLLAPLPASSAEGKRWLGLHVGDVVSDGDVVRAVGARSLTVREIDKAPTLSDLAETLRVPTSTLSAKRKISLFFPPDIREAMRLDWEVITPTHLNLIRVEAQKRFPASDPDALDWDASVWEGALEWAEQEVALVMQTMMTIPALRRRYKGVLWEGGVAVEELPTLTQRLLTFVPDAQGEHKPRLNAAQGKFRLDATAPWAKVGVLADIPVGVYDGDLDVWVELLEVKDD